MRLLILIPAYVVLALKGQTEVGYNLPGRLSSLPLFHFIPFLSVSLSNSLSSHSSLSVCDSLIKGHPHPTQ